MRAPGLVRSCDAGYERADGAWRIAISDMSWSRGGAARAYGFRASACDLHDDKVLWKLCGPVHGPVCDCASPSRVCVASAACRCRLSRLACPHRARAAAPTPRVYRVLPDLAHGPRIYNYTFGSSKLSLLAPAHGRVRSRLGSRLHVEVLLLGEHGRPGQELPRHRHRQLQLDHPCRRR